VPRDITLLWALRSPCAFACPHCYFGTIEDHKAAPPNRFGVLSHLSRTDLPADALMAFARSLSGSPVERVVIAGGEPLDWPGALEVIALIKQAGSQVVVATNGIPLTRPTVVERLVDLGVDGVSVSLDSADAQVNDRLRPSRSGRFGYDQVLDGIGRLLDARGDRTAPRVGIYTVIMRSRPQEISDMAHLAAEVGADYYVPQPISLAEDHKLFTELAHRPEDAAAVADQLDRLYADPAALALPEPSYARRFVEAISTHDSQQVDGCFGGARLFFIQPDGTLWDCPSDRRIAATPPERQRTIHGADARTLFASRPACTDCALFSRDCVNMWPLMDLTRLLNPEAAG
jgi:MoaA/NifB/PqqE/SkfB family radical SAM enzyme